MGKINTYKILYIGVFSESSTNTPQAQELCNLGHSVSLFEYRQRDINELKCIIDNYDILLIAKGGGIDYNIIKEFKKNNINTKIVYWFCDPLITFKTSPEFLNKCEVSDIICVDKLSVYNYLKNLNLNVHYICEGYVPYNVPPQEQIFDATFIGNIYNDERRNITNIPKIKCFNNKYNEEHSIVVKQSKININICTGQDASDRVYKILSSGGFLLTDKWVGMEKMGFQNNIHFITYKNINEIETLINYYLENEAERIEIAERGSTHIKNLNITVSDWAKNIIKTL